VAFFVSARDPPKIIIRNAHRSYDWALHAHVGSVSGIIARAWDRARGGRAQHSQIAAQPAVQSRDAIREAARRQNQLRPFARVRGLASRAARFAEHGVAQRLVSRIRRLHADAGIREGIAEINQIGEEEKDCNHVRGSGALAVPPFAHRRRAHRARDPRGAYCQRKARQGSHSHFLWEGSGRSHHLPSYKGRRRRAAALARIRKRETARPWTTSADLISLGSVVSGSMAKVVV